MVRCMCGGQRLAVLGQDGNALWEKSEISNISYYLIPTVTKVYT